MLLDGPCAAGLLGVGHVRGAIPVAISDGFQDWQSQVTFCGPVAMYACMYALRSLPVAVVVVAVLCAVVADAGAQPPSHLRSNRSRRAGTDELHRSDPLVFFFPPFIST